MGSRIAWLTFILTLATGSQLFRRTSHDESARQLAAHSQQKIEALEKPTHAMDKRKLKNLQELTTLLQQESQN